MKDEAQPLEFEVLPPGSTRDDMHLSRIIAWILDDLIPIPGTKYRIGLDPLIGLFPGLGDSSTAVFSSLILIHALRAGLPRIVLVRMALNILLNSLVGAIPVAGDVFSAWFKSNQRNYALLQKHAGAARNSTRTDWIFVSLIIGAVLLVAIGMSLLVGLVVYKLFSALLAA